jgi:aldehyde dehydrogenase (NAD+)
MKPSELTPLTCLALCNLAVEAGYPAGVLNVVPGFGHTTGSAISSHMDVDKVAFTGSVMTGRKIMEVRILFCSFFCF